MADAQAWIFLSIGDAGGVGGYMDLDKVIGAADANNHAVPTVAELRQAVRLLTGAGLVERDGDMLRLTRLGEGAYRQANVDRVGHITRLFNLSKVWETVPPPQVAQQDDWLLSDEGYLSAWKVYHERFWETYRRQENEGRLGKSRARTSSEGGGGDEQ